jgi:tellurite resistance protein
MLNETPLWRSAPTAIFPACLGFLGLGLGWRNAADFLPIAVDIGDVLLGFGSAYFVFFLVFYLRKLLARPSVLLEDMTNPAARAGVATVAMSMMLLAAALLPLGVSVPEIWWTGVILQIGASALGCLAIWKDPPGVRQFSTYQYLTFVGPVIGPVAGVPLGYITESIVLTFAALIPYVIITVGYAISLMRKLPPLHLRPTLAIFLAPNCLFALSFGVLGFEPLFHLFYWITVVVALCLLLLFPWMIKGGWSPVWASFTFPIGAFLQVQILGLTRSEGIVPLLGIYATLALGTPVIFYIVYRMTMMWASGELAEQSGAARV